MRDHQPYVFAIVLNWNRPKDTLECLDSLLPLVRKGQLTLIVCDNASTDDSVTQIQSWAACHLCETTRSNWNWLFLSTGGNLGYAGGNNVGIRYALTRPECKFIWILNNDTKITESALDELLKCAEQCPQVGFFGSTLLDYYNPDIVQVTGGCRYYPLTTIMKPVGAGKTLAQVSSIQASVKLDYISGAAFFCRAEVFRDVGLFDERFFLYYEEIDLIRRAKRVGYDLLWCPKSLVFHKGGVSTGSRSAMNPKGSWQSNYHENLSTLLYTAKHHPRLFWLVAGLRFTGKLVIYLASWQLDLISALLQAYLDKFFDKRPNLENSSPTVLGCGIIR